MAGDSGQWDFQNKEKTMERSGHGIIRIMIGRHSCYAKCYHCYVKVPYPYMQLLASRINMQKHSPYSSTGSCT
jgi:hypothetical protein